MFKIHIVGNPNSGKTTLFNSITKSSEHTGNWHGVTVDKKSKFIKFNNNEYELVDLPGIYSLNAFSLEEQISIDEIYNSECEKILYLLDANNFKRSMLLALNLLIENKNIKILINNYKTFHANGGEIDIEYLKRILGCEVEIIDAKKIKVDEKFFDFSTHKTAFIKTLANETNKSQHPQSIQEQDKEVEKHLKYNNVQILYKYILKIDKNAAKKQEIIYGYSKFDKKLLKISIFLPSFIILMFGVIYFTFFLAGPLLSGWFIELLSFTIQKPFMAIISFATRSDFVLALFGEGIFGACFSVLGFLPQICLIYLFLSMLENSGLIARMAFLLDDVLQKVGLSGKMVYTLLMGFGCSTTATITSKNMPDKNSQTKVALITPFISCSAKLPIYTMVALSLLGVGGVWLIFGLYLLGIAVAIVLAIVLERTVLPSKNSQLILEFAPLRAPKMFEVWQSIKTSCVQFVAKVFGVIFGASVVLWIISNINIRLEYVADVSKSILYSFSSIIAWIFKPIGLNNPNIICALMVGLVAKELILSTFAISNKVSSLSALGASITLASSAVNFNFVNGVSFLVFTLLYFPCISNLGVLIKEVGVKHTLLGATLQLVIAYTISYIIYNLLTHGLVSTLLTTVVITICVLSVKIIYAKIKTKQICCDCNNCNKCKK